MCQQLSCKNLSEKRNYPVQEHVCKKCLVCIFVGYEDSLDKSDVFSQGLTDSEESDSESTQMSNLSHISHKEPAKSLELQISPFLDLTYWKM